MEGLFGRELLLARVDVFWYPKSVVVFNLEGFYKEVGISCGQCKVLQWFLNVLLVVGGVSWVWCWSVFANDVGMMYFFTSGFLDTLNSASRNSICFFCQTRLSYWNIVSSRCRFNHLDPITALLLTRTNLLFFYSIIFLNVSLFYIIIFFHLDRPRENVFFL